jgi:hypothetical protein
VRFFMWSGDCHQPYSFYRRKSFQRVSVLWESMESKSVNNCVNLSKEMI